METAATPTTAKPKARRCKAEISSNDRTPLRNSSQEVGSLEDCDRSPPIPQLGRRGPAPAFRARRLIGQTLLAVGVFTFRHPRPTVELGQRLLVTSP
jgi:hypothetical protein